MAVEFHAVCVSQQISLGFVLGALESNGCGDGADVLTSTCDVLGGNDQVSHTLYSTDTPTRERERYIEGPQLEVLI